MNKNYIKVIALGTALLFSSLSQAALVDLSTWQKDGKGYWQVQPDNGTVKQARHGNSSVFFKDGSNVRDTAINGQITVAPNWDNDFVGFVLGYQDNELRSTAADYWLIDWKKGNQNNSYAGLSLSHVTDGSQERSFWDHTPGAVTEVARATNLANAGWVGGITYNFDITHTANLIEVRVNNSLELSVTAAQAGVSEFTDGAFGFYNNSQSGVSYSSIERRIVDETQVPGPSTLAIFALGIAGLLARQSKKS